jgi:hypothetical protein
MPIVCNFSAWLARSALMCAAATLQAATLQAAEQFAPLAQSAQLTLEGGATPAGLTLRIHAATAAAPVSVTEVSVSIDGASAPAVRQADGSWFVPLPAARTARGGKLEVFVRHDGIREVLSGTIALPAAGSAREGGAGAVLRDHKQMAWWILNIAVVLIAAIAISRRMS